MNLISEIDLLIASADPMPESRTPRCRELLLAAAVVVDELLDEVNHASQTQK